jgi:hypothetical protein
MDEVSDETAREPYEAPTIEDIPLRAEEQLLAGCKTPRTRSPIRDGHFCGACRAPVGS